MGQFFMDSGKALPMVSELLNGIIVLLRLHSDVINKTTHRGQAVELIIRHLFNNKLVQNVLYKRNIKTR